jgi:hypothetical protein
VEAGIFETSVIKKSTIWRSITTNKTNYYSCLIILIGYMYKLSISVINMFLTISREAGGWYFLAKTSRVVEAGYFCVEDGGCKKPHKNRQSDM